MVEKITSRQVAARAGVSQSAVSRFYTPGASVSAKTAEKVRLAAHELGYRPNALARAMITGKSRIIGIIVGYLENQFYPEALERLSITLQKSGYHLLVFMARNDEETARAVAEELLDYQVDGIIAASVSMSNDLTARCEASGVPVVLFNRLQDDPRLSGVASNNFEGGREIARFLAAGGHQKIAHIAGWAGASTQRDREAGLIAGLKENKLKLFAREEGNFHTEEARAATRALFNRSERPDAVFVATDHMAFAVMDVLRYEFGLSIPQDVSVIGYDDVEIASWPSYDLTTVQQPLDQMVRETVDMITARIDFPETPPYRATLPGPLILRSSAKVPDGWQKKGF